MSILCAHLIDSCQVSVHVAREATPTRHFLSGSRYLRERETEMRHYVLLPVVYIRELSDAYLSQSFSIGAHISEDN